DGTPIPSALRRPTFGWDGTGSDLLADYNAGRFLIFHRDHGWEDGWANPTLTSNDVPSMNNGTKLPVVFGVDCASGTFDSPGHPSFDELQVEKAGGGAVAAFGDTRTSPTWANNHMSLGFFDALFPNVLPSFGSSSATQRLGDVLLSGKAYMATQNNLDGQGADETYQEHYLYHLFGDPSAQIWAEPAVKVNPASIHPVYVAQAPLNPGDPPCFVHVPIPGPVPEGALVTLYNSGQPIGRALVHDGVADVQPELNTDRGDLTVSIDGQGDLPVSKAVENTATTLSATCPGAQDYGSSAPVSGHLDP